MTSWSLFRIVCLFHVFIDIFMGLFMIFNINTLSRLIHGDDVTKQLHLADLDEKSQLIQTSESLVGMMLIFIGILLYMISNLEDIPFQRFISKGCILIHVLLIVWRIFVESKIQALQKDVQGQIITDVIFVGTWITVLFFTRNRIKTTKDK